jgi:hypothetical protein
VAQLFPLSFQVALEGGFGGNGGVNAFGDADSGCLEGGDLFRIIGNESDGRDIQVFEDGGGQFKGAEIGGKAEHVVGFDRIETLILELVGAEFGHEPDAATFLLLVKQDTGALVGDALKGEMELVVAVAAERVEDVTGEALGVDAHDRRDWLAVGSGRVNVTHYERDGSFDGFAGGIAGLRDAFEAENAKVAPAGGEVGVSDFGQAEKRHSLRLDEWGAGRMRRTMRDEEREKGTAGCRRVE